MAAPYKPKTADLTTAPVLIEPRAPTDAEIAAYLKAKVETMTDEEVEAANIAHQRKLVQAEMDARRAAKANLAPRSKDQLVIVRLTHDYWPSPQQVVDNPQVPSDLAILPPPYEDKVGVAIIGEARFKAGAVLYLDMDTALTLLSDQKAVRADPLRTVAGNA